jgi:OmpR family response regulator RpaB
MPRILLIDDDELLAAPLAAYLSRFGFELQAATRPSLGLARLEAGGFDAAILDVMLPEMDGFELCRRIRRHADESVNALPVIMLTARGELMDRVVGLEIGADDYLPKPFEPRELAARLQTVLRRQARPSVAEARAVRSDQQLVFDGITIDLARREVLRRAGPPGVAMEPVELTGTEFELLCLLAHDPGRVFSRDEILNSLRGHEADLYTRAVDILISRLRRKLEPLDVIKTLRNAGYTFAGARA